MSRLALLAVLLALPAGAKERAFAVTWDTGSLQRGAKEVQLWLSPRLERTEQHYTRFDLRAGLAQGVSDRLESLLTLDLDLESWGTDARAIDSALSWQLRYRMLPATAPVGLGFFTRLALGPGVAGFEGRLVLDKQLGEVLLAANASVLRLASLDGRHRPDFTFEGTLAARLALGAGTSVSFEGLSRTTLSNGVFQGTGYYLGPGFTWRGHDVWLAVAMTAQVAGDKASADVGNGEPLVLRDQERFLGRLVVGFATP